MSLHVNFEGEPNLKGQIPQMYLYKKRSMLAQMLKSEQSEIVKLILIHI